jgi:peptide/nickel transport system substrate-binding protein
MIDPIRFLEPSMTVPSDHDLLHITRRTAIKSFAAVAGLATIDRAFAVDAPASKTVKWGYNLPTRWDPVVSVTGYDIHLMSLVYSGLTRLDAHGVAQPALAESWKYNQDGTELTFTLRPNLKFSDGTPVDANAVRQFLLRAKTQRGSSAAEPLQSVKDVVVDGPLVARLLLTEADYQLPLVLSGRPGLITSPAAGADPEKLAKWPVGAGPFKVTEVVTESHAFFERDPAYWDAKNILLDRIELYVALDKTSVVAALQSGVYDISEINPNQVEQAKRAGLVVDIEPSLDARAILINKSVAPFDDPNVVEAVRYAVNRQEFIDKITFGYAKATNQPFPPGDPAFSDAVFKLWSYDPDKAKQLLAKSRYKGDRLKVTIKGEAGTVLEILQKQLKAIGIPATIDSLSSAQSINVIMVQKAAQIATNIGTQGRESPVLGLQAPYGVSGNLNLSAPYASKEFLEALDAVRHTPLDAEDYPDKLHEAVKAALTSNPTLWLYSSPRILAHNPKLTNIPSVPITYRWEGAKISV